MQTSLQKSLQKPFRVDDQELSAHEAASKSSLALGPEPKPPPPLEQAEGAELAYLDAPLDAWLKEDECLARRARLGMGPGTQAADFASSCEFISLGSTCQTSRGVQALGLKRFTYPFDWLQSPLSGIIHLFETGFEDFLTCSVLKDTMHTTGEKFGFMRARWGGSFWHHDVESSKIKEDFGRRIRRLLGTETQTLSSTPRVFVRAVASTIELDLTLQLHETLRQALPDSRIYLLMIVELQDDTEAIALPVGGAADVCLYRIQGHLYADAGKLWTKQAHTEQFATAIACAISIWSGQAKTSFSSLEEACALCDQMDSGDPGSQHFWPRRFRGQRLNIRRAPRMPRLFPDSLADVVIPSDAEADDVLRMSAFDINDIHVRIPHGAAAGQMIRLHLADGLLTAKLLPVIATGQSITVDVDVDVWRP